MAGVGQRADDQRVMEIVLWILTACAFIGLVAAVPIALRESRQDELEIRDRR